MLQKSLHNKKHEQTTRWKSLELRTSDRWKWLRVVLKMLTSDFFGEAPVTANMVAQVAA